MGRFITLPGVNPPSDRPKIDTIDAILPNAGALMLVDLAHPSDYWAGNLAATGQPVKNIAEEQALAAIGSSDPAAVAVTTIGQLSGFSGGTGILERSSKGGIHVAVSPTIAAANTGFSLVVSNSVGAPTLALLEYLRATTHTLYMSAWTRTTRVGPIVSNGNPDVAHIASTTQPANYRRHILSAQGYATPLSGGRYPAVKAGFLSPDLGPHIYTSASTGWTGTQPGAATGTRLNLFVAGSNGLNGYTDALRRARECLIFYRFYLEDLTVSGRTYAQVDAIDFALYTQDVLTAGGRYYGDTFTDPATLT